MSEQLLNALALVRKDFDIILKNEFVMGGGDAICAPLFSATESLDNAIAFAGPKGDALAANIENGRHSALDLAARHVKAMLEQFAVATEAGMKPFLQWKRLYESAQTLPAFIDDAKDARRV